MLGSDRCYGENKTSEEIRRVESTGCFLIMGCKGARQKQGDSFGTY